MRALVYNRWLSTLGGGEQTLGAFVQALQTRFDVDVITHDPPDWDAFHRVLGMALHDVPTMVVPMDEHYREVSAATRDYDVFVNCSYLDHVRAYAKLNVLQVFFPPARPSAVESVRPLPAPPVPSRRPGASAGVAVSLQAVGGLYRLEQNRRGVFAWSDGRARFALAGATRDTAVSFVLSSESRADRSCATLTVSADGQVLARKRCLASNRPARVDVVVPHEIVAARPVVFIDVVTDTFSAPGDDRYGLGVMVYSAAASAPGRRAADTTFPHGLTRWTDAARFDDAIGTYDLLLANSHFTQRWIARRFGRASELLYPPVQTERFAPTTKQPWIISVGRFFVEGHSKKQLQMIQLFRRLHERGELPGWQYHLVGGTRHDVSAQRYYERCVAEAEGAPIVLHPDASLDELVRLYAQSTLYWNATGYGEDPDVEPDRFEHFGMTTVEAMAAGCVPLSYARAGQPEVIEHSKNGMLFETLDELAAESVRLAADPYRSATMALAARSRSTLFSVERFERAMWRLLADQLADL